MRYSFSRCHRRRAMPVAKTVKIVLFTALVASAGSLAIPAQAQYLGPTPYLSATDSPFNGGSFSYFFLEDFEDSLLNTPGVTASTGIVINGNDSVENAPQNGSFYSNGANVLTFSFNAVALGALPTSAGIVWTDVGFSTPAFGFGNVLFEAFDSTSTSLGVFGPFNLGDGTPNPAKAEDRFFGVTNAGGISAIRISMPGSTDWEVDHLQYGRASVTAAPEPGTLAFLALGMLPVAAIARRRRRNK